MKQLPHQDFLEIFNKALITVPTETIETLNNGTGYFDEGVDIEIADLEVGKNAAGTSRNGRKVLFHKTPIGNIVIFERYIEGANGVLVWNTPKGLSNRGRVGVSRSELIGFNTLGHSMLSIITVYENIQKRRVMVDGSDSIRIFDTGKYCVDFLNESKYVSSSVKDGVTQLTVRCDGVVITLVASDELIIEDNDYGVIASSEYTAYPFDAMAIIANIDTVRISALEKFRARLKRDHDKYWCA